MGRFIFLFLALIGLLVLVPFIFSLVTPVLGVTFVLVLLLLIVLFVLFIFLIPFILAGGTLFLIFKIPYGLITNLIGMLGPIFKKESETTYSTLPLGNETTIFNQEGLSQVEVKIKKSAKLYIEGRNTNKIEMTAVSSKVRYNKTVTTLTVEAKSADLLLILPKSLLLKLQIGSGECLINAMGESIKCAIGAGTLKVENLSSNLQATMGAGNVHLSLSDELKSSHSKVEIGCGSCDIAISKSLPVGEITYKGIGTFYNQREKSPEGKISAEVVIGLGSLKVTTKL